MRYAGVVRYPIAICEDEGTIVAHSPCVPGAYGLGDTEAEAVSDLRESLELMLTHIRECGEELPRGIPDGARVEVLEIR